MLACLFSVRDQLDGKTKERCGPGRIYRGGGFFNYFNDSLAQVRKRNKRASEGEEFPLSAF
jgi:hypothetical protein